MEEEITIQSNIENLELYSDQYPFRLSLRIKNFETEADYKKYVKNCEKLIRTCLEYKEWKSYIIDVLGINSCMITEERIDEVSLEVHHHVPSLYTIVSAVINKKVEIY